MSEYDEIDTNDKKETTNIQSEKIPEEYTVIIDIGEGYVKVGFAGEEEPRSIFPTITGKEKYKNVMVDVGAHTKQSYVGKDCMSMRGVLKIIYPIRRGNIMDWDAYFSVLTHIFYNVLRIDSSKANIIYCENPLTPLQTKQYIARVLFETYKAKSVYIAPSPILALFSAGLTTGLVIESGEGLTHVTPVINGNIMYQAVQKLTLAGSDVGENLKSWLLRTGISISGTSAEREILREIKEKNCFISLNPQEAGANSRESTPYVMPDGESVDISMDVRVNAPEILFHPEILGYNTLSLPQAVIEAVRRVDSYYWRELLSNIVLSGGNTMFYGIELRLEQDINNLLYQLGPLPEPVQKTPVVPQKQTMVNLDTADKSKDTCPKCGTRVDLTESSFCPQCGTDMRKHVISIPSGTVEKYPENCPSCNKHLKEQSAFCPYCGAKIEKIVTQIPAGLSPMEVAPQIEEFEMSASEFEEDTPADDQGKIVKIKLPERRDKAIFNGASVSGALESFKKLFITYEEYLANPNSVEVDFSKIL